MQNILVVVHLLITIALIGTVLMQRSEGGALGIGGGGSGNLFSSRGVGNALTRATAFLAICFFATSILLAVLATRQGGTAFDSVLPTQQGAPATQQNNSSGGAVLPDLGQDSKPSQPQVPTSQ